MLIHFTNNQVAHKKMGVLKHFNDILETSLWHGQLNNIIRIVAIMKVTHLLDVGHQSPDSGYEGGRGQLWIVLINYYGI